MDELLGQVARVTAGLLFMQAVSAAFAYGFHNWRRNIPPRSRIIFSSLAGGLLLVMPGIVLFLVMGDDAGQTVFMLVAMLVGALFMAVACLPGAWWATTRLERIDQVRDVRSTFE